MTKLETCDFLETCRRWFEPYTSEKEKWNEALDMAIEALTQDSRKVTKESTQDLISRQDAIDAWWHDEVFFGNQRDDMTKEQWLDYITDVIGSLPSADRPTGEWVPIEDGLPDINIKHKGMYGDPDWYSSSLVMIKTDEPYLDPLGYEVGQFEMSADGEMYDFYDGNYYIKLKNIIAWMPIKPYKGGK